MVKTIKSLEKTIPILAVVTPSATLDIEAGTLEIPAEVDWLGMDNYHCWGVAECEAPLPSVCRVIHAPEFSLPIFYDGPPKSSAKYSSGTQIMAPIETLEQCCFMWFLDCDRSTPRTAAAG
jgi:hypothetical protein